MRPTDKKRGDPPPRASVRVDPYTPAREASEGPAESAVEVEPAPQRSFVIPLAIALAVFVVMIAVRLLWRAGAGGG